MSEPKTKQTLQDERVVMTHGEWRIEFNNASEAPQISQNCQLYGLHKSLPKGDRRADGLIVSAHVANGPTPTTPSGHMSEILERCISPAVLWHRTNGRLTKDDIAKTICDDKDNPIGIYMGVWTPDWAKGKQIRTYAAITDARDGNHVRLALTFNQYVAYLNNHPNGEKLLDRPEGARNVAYEMAMQARILELQPRQRTGHMITPLELLRGLKHLGYEVTHRNNMYDLRHIGDFAEADNGGNDSRFVTEAGSDRARWYVSSTEDRDNRDFIFGTAFADAGGAYGTAFTDAGGAGWGHKYGSDWSLRPFVAEIPQP